MATPGGDHYALSNVAPELGADRRHGDDDAQSSRSRDSLRRQFAAPVADVLRRGERIVSVARLEMAAPAAEFDNLAVMPRRLAAIPATGRPDDRACWEAVLARDPAMNGRFLFGVL